MQEKLIFNKTYDILRIFKKESYYDCYNFKIGKSQGVRFLKSVLKGFNLSIGNVVICDLALKYLCTQSLNNKSNF